MPKEKFDGITYLNGEKRKLGYTDEFRTILKEQPGIIKTVIKLADQAVEEYYPPDSMYGEAEFTYDKESGKWFEKGQEIDGQQIPMYIDRRTILVPGKLLKDENSGLEVAVLGRLNRERNFTYTGAKKIDKADYLIITFKGHSFFVKRTFTTHNPGFTEFKNTVEAKKLLEGLDFVKVVDAQLGYHDNNQSWYVSKWEDLERAGFAPVARISYSKINDYGLMVGVPDNTENMHSGFANEEEYIDVQNKYKTIKNWLRSKSIGFDLEQNLFYNPKTKKFILLDVTG